MSFRASHYFVSFISEASAVACGFGCQRSLAPHLGVTKWDVPVAEPHNIEVPRSLVEVVVSWNIPMHKWLKKILLQKYHTIWKISGSFLNFFCQYIFAWPQLPIRGCFINSWTINVFGTKYS